MWIRTKRRPPIWIFVFFFLTEKINLWLVQQKNVDRSNFSVLNLFWGAESNNNNKYSYIKIWNFNKLANHRKRYQEHKFKHVLGVLLSKTFDSLPKILWNIRSRPNSSTFWVFEPVFPRVWSKSSIFCTKILFWSDTSKHRPKLKMLKS